MASIARNLRPLASRVSTRPYRHAASCYPLSASVRSFSVSRTVFVKKYSKDHEWIELSEDKKTGTIGISDYAAHALGDVVYVELPSEGLEASAGDAIGAVESVKSASDISAPISCTITSFNASLEDTPGVINKGPEDTTASGGWVAKVSVSEVGAKDFEELMDAEEYKKFTEDE